MNGEKENVDRKRVFTSGPDFLPDSDAHAQSGGDSGGGANRFSGLADTGATSRSLCQETTETGQTTINRGGEGETGGGEKETKRSPIKSAETGKKTKQARRSGQIVARGENKWLVRVHTGRNEITGKRKYFNKTIRGTKKDAQKFLNSKLREIDLGVFIEPATESLDAYLDKWLESAAKPKLSERSFNDYEALLKRYVRERLGSLRLVNLRPLDIQALYSKMQEQGLSARVIRYTHAVLSSALKQAVHWGMLTRNPAQLAQLPKQKRREMHALSAVEVACFLDVLQGTRYAVLFAFAITTGMRPEEYFALQWKDVDLEKGVATVRRALIRKKGGGWYFTEPKTPQSRRSIPLPASMAAQIKAHRRAQAEERLKAGSAYQNNELVFATEWGTPLDLSNLTNNHFKPALKRAGLPKSVRLYDLRHTCATLLLLAGENPKVVSERLGHASVTLTLDTYSHVLPDMQRGAAEKLEKLIFAGVGTL